MIVLESGLTVVNEKFSLVLSHQKPARVILAVPHDGFIANDLSGLFSPRVRGIKGRDAHVWPIANDVVRHCLESGVRVDAVRLLMPRTYIDGNREAPTSANLDPDTLGQTAFDDARLRPIYEHYHGELARLVERSTAAYGAGQVLFIDLHGFGKQPSFAPPGGYGLILGTANRSTIQHGAVDRKFAAFMQERDHVVFLPGEAPVRPEGDPYSAGHTTRWYARRYGINAIQIETCPGYRRREGEQQGKKLALDLAGFFTQNYN